MEFFKPEFKWGENPIGVYRITIDDKCIYIGSSPRIKNRFSTWESKMRYFSEELSINIKQAISNISIVKFEIIEHCDKGEIKCRETHYISLNWGDPFLLNRCPNAENNTGRKKPIGYVPKYKIKKERVDTSIKIAVFDKYNTLIEICNSKEAVRRKYKYECNILNKILRGECGQSRKYTFKEVVANGDIIEPIKYVRASISPILQLSIDGEFIFEHPSTLSVVKKTGISTWDLWKHLKNKNTLTAPLKGYLFMYK